MSDTITELEHRVQLAQDALSAALDSASVRLHLFRVQKAEQALRQALIADAVASRPASPHCKSGGRIGCTCEVCF